MTVVSSISKKSLGHGGSSDTNHIVLGYADKFVEGCCRQLVWREACKWATRRWVAVVEYNHFSYLGEM